MLEKSNTRQDHKKNPIGLLDSVLPSQYFFSYCDKIWPEQLKEERTHSAHDKRVQSITAEKSSSMSLKPLATCIQSQEVERDKLMHISAQLSIGIFWTQDSKPRKWSYPQLRRMFPLQSVYLRYPFIDNSMADPVWKLLKRFIQLVAANQSRASVSRRQPWKSQCKYSHHPKDQIH